MKPEMIKQILDWFRNNDRNVYTSALSSIAQARKLRPVFIQKKSVADQYAWIHKTLKLASCETIGEHLLQAYLMTAQQAMLATFCDGMSIPHDGKGSVVGDLPKELSADALKQTVDTLLEKNTPELVSIYLHCLNMQMAQGWDTLTTQLKDDQRLQLA